VNGFDRREIPPLRKPAHSPPNGGKQERMRGKSVGLLQSE
jgi:hypothetical protein